MESVADRRTFVRNIVVGLPVIAATTSVPEVMKAFEPHNMPPVPPALDSALRDLARLHNQLRRRPITADDRRAVAAHVRGLVAYQLQSGHDTEMARAVRDVIARQGHDAIAGATADPEVMRRELVAFGFDLPSAFSYAPTTEERSKALERIARSGLAPSYFDAAESIEGFDFSILLAGPSDVCTTLKEMQRSVEAMAAVMCTLTIMVPVLAPDCFAATSVMAMLKLLTFLMQC